jgi:hypothetical protein
VLTSSSFVNMSSINQLTAAQLRKAANLKDHIASLEKQLVELLPLGGSGSGMPTPLKTVKPARKKISAAGIAKIRAAQKARWATVVASKSKKVSVVKVAPRKRTMSAAAKAKISAAAKARWAKIKAAKK